MNSPSRTLYTNCNAITGDRAFPRSQALLVSGSRIVAIGSDAEAAAGQLGVRHVDLGGSTVIPGFDDCHMHVLSFGLTLSQVDLSPSAAADIATLRRAIDLASKRADGADWVLGRGYNQNLLPEQRHPNRFDLDPVSGIHPVALWHTSGHIMTCNSTALELAGISRETPDPTGGEIERDDRGKPTGVLRETAMELLAAAIPEPSFEFAAEAILRASTELARDGITSATDAATGHGESPDFELGAYRAALDSGRLLTRLTLMPQIRYVVPNDGGKARPSHEFNAGDQPEWLRIGPTKIFSDGALTTRTAAVSSPYLNSGGNGILTWRPADLERLIRSAHGAGRQVATHAIGDRAIRLVLGAYRAAASETPRRDARHRIEHCTLVGRDDVRSFNELGIVSVVQPEDIACLGDAYPAAIGVERARNNSPVGWFENAGARIAFSSDRPVTPGHPLMGVRAAMERRTASGIDLGIEHRVSAEQAIGYYTFGSAFASFAEHDRGVLAPGFLADFVVLDRDITRTTPEELSSANILMTVVHGRAAYEA